MAASQDSRVRILGLRVAKRAEDGNSLSGLVATFDARIPQFALFGCALFRMRNGLMTVSPPRHDRVDGTSTGLRIEDEALKAELIEASCAVAKLFGASVDPVEPVSHGFSEIGAKLLDPDYAGKSQG